MVYIKQLLLIMKRLLFYFFMCLLVLSSCGDKTDKYMSMGAPMFVKKFAYEVKSLTPVDFECKEIGINSIKFIDTLMIIGHSDHWSVYSSCGKNKYGDILTIGDGPGEYYQLPRCAAAAYVNENDSLIIYIPDKEKGNINRFNLSKYIAQGGDNVISIKKTDYLTNDLWDVIPCDSSEFLLSMPNFDFTGFRRMLLSGNKLSEVLATKTMSDLTVDREDDINLLARVTRYNPLSDKFVEGMLYLNQINIFSRDGTYGKTICVGNHLDNIADIESEFKFDRKNSYTTVSVWNQGFGCTFSGQTEKNRQMGEETNSELHMFDWDGNPICLVNIPHSVVAFDIDFRVQRLYIINGEDELKVYDASPILEAFL